MLSIQKLMDDIPFFSNFTTEEKAIFLQDSNFYTSYKDGDVIIQEGDLQDSSLYIIVSGTALVRRDEYPDNIIAIFEGGSILGEASFLLGRPRTASVIADGEVTAFKFNRSFMERLDCQFQLRITNQLVEVIVDRFESITEALSELMG
ncbi:MAG: cyclic nucleotide-binding domain-containing protein [Magnetococcales bacterium]|nr:cyclic nucleotide-binding domain-containing protein [Magnetococcales bacterium]